MKRKLFSLFFAALISVSMWATEGALSGRFTINANGDRVVFSQGNLQYKDGTGWRFAEHQWDFIGAWNTSDWIDLFGWGTGANPTLSTWNYSDYSTFVDWGTNAISNGGNTANEWYSLSLEEWSYIFNTRANASNLRGHSTVNGINGYVLLPDGFSIPDGLSFTPVVGWGSNVYTEQQWAQMEAAGAVFFPASGCRASGTSIGSVGEFGGYYTSSNVNDNNVYNMSFGTTWAGPDGIDTRCYGRSVRLVRSALEQDADGYYLIGSVDDWKDFATLVQTTPTANAKMTADIDLGEDQTMIGSNNTYPYSGIFDGQGHTLTVAYNNTDAGLYVAPFSYIYGATIRNLHVAGTIQTACQNAGVVSKYGGSGNVVENVWSSLAIQTNWTVNGGIWECCSGLIGSTLAGTNASLIMRDCLFTGSVVATSGDQSGCFMGYVDTGCSANVSNCLSVGTYSYTATNSSVTRDRMSIDNSFVKQFPNAIPAAMQLTNERLADGSIAYKLQNNRTDLVWGQRIGIDAEPVLTNDESYRVYKSKNGGYTNNPEEAMQQDGEGYFLLGSLQDWRAFAELINSGMNTANAKMTADINLGDDQTMIGLGSVDGRYGDGNLLYTGIFDGQGHTLTINYVANERFVAPFRHIQDATIKNLRVTGTIATSEQFTGGIVGACYGEYRDNYITNCISSVNIVSSWVNTEDTHINGSLIGGIVGKLCYYNRLHISDCIFNGSISGENRTVVWGGFVGLPDGTIIVRNSLLTAEFDCTNVLVGTNGAGTFSSVFGGGYASTIDIDASNYYLNALGSVQGTQATAEQLADGTIATALQAGRAEEIWVQEGTTPMLKLFVTPIEAITANEDPDHAGVYYSTFYDSAKKYALPNDGTEAYAAEVNDGAMYLHKIAEGNDVLPAGTAVIFKATSGTITLTESDDAPVAISVTNHLRGVDVDTEISSVVTGTCYVLSGGSNGVGFYLYEYPNQLKAHKAYIDLNGGGAAQAPKHLRFVFDSATAIENTEADVKVEKCIENGVLYIIKNGVKYNAQGQTVK